MRQLIHIKQNPKPELKMPKFNVDVPLAKKLDDYDLTSLLNRHNFTLFLGKAGSGKSSLCISLLQTKSMFKRVYHNIILFCPPNSRASVKNDFWNTNLPVEQIYDELNLENLEEAYELAQADGKNCFKTLFIFDDVQSALKDTSIQKLLLHIVNNRRHSCVSIWLLCQSYFSIPRMVRNALTDLFLFKISKNDMREIMKEQIEMDLEKFTDVLKNSFKNPHDFLYINSLSRRLFLNFDEIIYNDESDDEM